MKNEDMHILVIPSWYPTTDEPNRGIFFKEQSHNLYDINVKVSVVYPEVRWIPTFSLSKFKENHFQIREYNEDGIITIRKHGWNTSPGNSQKQAKNWVKQALKLAEIYISKYGKPDLIHAHSTLWGGYTAMLVSQKYNIPYIITEHSTSYARNAIKDWEIPYIKEAFNNASKILAVSSPFAKLLQKYSKNPIEVIHNPVNISFFEIPKSRQKKPFTFLSVAFLEHKKGMDVLINAFNKAFKNQKDVILNIGGDGEERKKLEELVTKLELTDQVNFIGGLSRNEVKEQMMKNNAFVLPSRFETFGVVFIEALSTGMPIIATRCGGPEDIVSEKVGKLVEVEDVDGLANAMVYIYENYDLYDSNELRQYCNDNFSKEVITNKLIDIYKNIL
ncbi:glycosyltransferase [Clostridium niameyense]|uniref:glycosyltransferase n=1 Tax=Clostridium niameyense TaxID=1622073 RepID=UPI00067E7098|nr:glycosyltransferase [Clostridium niameyense]